MKGPGKARAVPGSCLQQLHSGWLRKSPTGDPSGAPALPSTWQEAHSIFQTPFSPSACLEPGWRGDVYFLLPARSWTSSAVCI